MDMRFMFYVRFCLLLLPNSPELGHTHTPRALLILPSLDCATSSRATRFHVSDAPFGPGRLRELSTSG